MHTLFHAGSLKLLTELLCWSCTRDPPMSLWYLTGTWKHGSVGQSEGLLIPGSSVRFHLKPENSNSGGFELHRPSVKGTKLLLKVKRTIIIIPSVPSLTAQIRNSRLYSVTEYNAGCTQGRGVMPRRANELLWRAWACRVSARSRWRLFLPPRCAGSITVDVGRFS